MEYADVVAASFEPSPDGVIAEPTRNASAARRFRDAIEPIAMHSVWSEVTNTRQAELGLNFITGYVWGRAAALGTPDAGVVVSSFAVFEPSMVTGIYEQARATVDRDTLLDARTESTIASLTSALGDANIGEIAEAAETLQASVSAADGTGRPLFSGFKSQPWPEDPIGKLWHACELAREHRGDSHVAVCVSSGLAPVEMNILTELWVGMPLGSYTGTRGWSPEIIAAAADGLRAQGLLDGDLLSDGGREFRAELEDATDNLEQPIIEALGPDSDALIERLGGWSQRCIDAQAFPPSVHKRAAG